jgi:MFS family permease
VLREPPFRRFYLGYVTSLLGTSMASLALAFAVLGSGGTPVDLGYVFAAGIVPQVLFLVVGGVVADARGRRVVMLAAEAACGCAQAVLAVSLFTGRPPVWLFVAVALARGTGEAFFTPALTGLTPQIASPGELGNANAMLGVARSSTSVAGPALAGLLIAVAGPAVVVALDAASFGVSVLALAGLRPAAGPPVPAASAGARQAGPPGRPDRGDEPVAGAAPAPGVSPSPPRRARRFRADLADGWAEFRAVPWLVVGAVQFALFNLLVWGPFLVLGPVLATSTLGGAGAWGAVMACYGAGAVLGGLLALGRRPRRPVVAATVADFGYAAPCGLLALGAPVAAVAAGAVAAGICSALGGAFTTTAMQRTVAADALARVSAFEIGIAYAFGPVAFAAAGPVAAVVGVRAVLGFGAAWTLVSSAAVLALPSIRAVTSPQQP